MPRGWHGWSLRGKLIVACVAVQLAAAAALVLGSARLLQQGLVEQAQSETQQVIALLDQAIAAPLAQRDYATLQQTLDLVRKDASIRYLVLADHRGQVVASSGWDTAKPLPARDGQVVDLDRPDTTWHLATPVMLAGQWLGHVDLGLSTQRLRAARVDFLQHSLAIGTLALTVSMAVLAAIAFAVTRHLARLAHASQRVAAGDFDVHIPVTTGDEIGRLGEGFNTMAAALKQRVQALQSSEGQQRAHLLAAQEEQSRLTTLLGAMRSGILFADGSGRVVYANVSFTRIWSLPGLASGRDLKDIVPLLQRQIDLADAVHLQALLQVQGAEEGHSRELHTLDGRIIAQRMQPVGQAGEAGGGGCIWFHDDITLERQTQHRAHQALHDPLTQLHNRRGFYEALQGAIAQATAHQSPVALLFVDLDDFKHANDLGGHRKGDEILTAVATSLTAQMRRGEIVARLGGDEFAVLCPGTGATEAQAIAARLVQAVGALRFAALGQTLRVGCSVGVATFPADAQTEDDLLACADAAMYQAKDSGKNAWAAYRNDPQQVRATQARVDWNARIHRALQQQRFVLHFQPVHRASDLRVMHHEALLRMVDEADPERLISPAVFIPHAERSGKIRLIDRWVFETCVAQLAREDAGVHIAANLSARSLEDPSFPGFVRDLLQAHDVDPRRLHVELTETSAIGEAGVARQLIDAVRGLGCAVHLDDFGAGFHSFTHLKMLDVDTIKIDGAFIRDLATDTSNQIFTASMIEVAHQLNKTVVAEHVEDAATLDILRRLGVDCVQGFHLARPGPQLAGPRSRLRLQVVPGAARPGST
jgi:diguanylate cyclase (GGDEF)-like protein